MPFFSESKTSFAERRAKPLLSQLVIKCGIYLNNLREIPENSSVTATYYFSSMDSFEKHKRILQDAIKKPGADTVRGYILTGELKDPIPVTKKSYVTHVSFKVVPKDEERWAEFQINNSKAHGTKIFRDKEYGITIEILGNSTF